LFCQSLTAIEVYYRTVITRKQPVVTTCIPTLGAPDTPVTLTFLPQGHCMLRPCHGLMDYMSNDFGADSSSRFPSIVPTHRPTDKQTDREMRLNALPHACGYTAGVDNNASTL